MTVRRAVAGGGTDMTGANRSPTQQTTRGLRCQSVPTPAQAARQGLQAAVLGQDSAGHRRFRSEANDWNLGLWARVTLVLGKLGTGGGRWPTWPASRQRSDANQVSIFSRPHRVRQRSLGHQG